MRKNLIVILTLFFILIGCAQPQIVKYDNKNIIDKVEHNLTSKERKILSYHIKKMYVKNLEKLRRERVLRKVNYNTWIYESDGLKIDFQRYGNVKINYYGEYTEQKKRKANQIINKIENNINLKISKLKEIIKKIKDSIKNHPYETIKISSPILNEEQKRFFINKLIKNYYLSISCKDFGFGCFYYVKVNFYKTIFKYPFLTFVFKGENKVYDTKNISITLFVDVKFLPKYNVKFDSIKFDVISYEKGWSNSTLAYKIKCENDSDRFYKINYLTFYYNKEVLTFSNEIVLPPYTKITKEYDTSLSSYKLEITKKNKNSLVYGLATKIANKSYSKIFHTTFDELFKKYVK